MGHLYTYFDMLSEMRTDINRVKPKHLELVLKIAETEQLQLAAQATAMSQPAASRILTELEAQFGHAFFVRHPGGMEPTQAGEVFVRHARSVLTELGTLGDEMAHLRSGQAGTVRVGSVTGPAVGHLMPAVQAFLAKAPDVRISVDVAPSATLFRRLEEARYDFILGRAVSRHGAEEFRFHPGRIENVSLMVHRSHPLAGQPVAELATLADFPWVIQEAGSPIREAVEQAFHGAGLAAPHRVLNSSSLLVALAQVAQANAIAPQTEEVMRLLLSDRVGAAFAALQTRQPITVSPYFVIQSARRKLPRAAERLLAEVMARF